MSNSETLWDNLDLSAFCMAQKSCDNLTRSKVNALLVKNVLLRAELAFTVEC